MKIRRWLALILFTAILTAFAPAALAEDVRITVVAEPSELTAEGVVELNFSISNYSDYELSSIQISTGGTVYPLAEENIVIPPSGTAYNLLIEYPVPESQIGLEIPFNVVWSQGGELRSLDVPVTIARAADPVISLARTSDKTHARQGDLINVHYVLTNTTKFDMTGIILIDENISDNPVYSGGTLLAGQSLPIDYQYTMGASDVTSTPVVTYEVNDKTKTFSAVEPLTFRLMLVQMSMDVSLGTPTVSGVPFSIDLKNTGNQDISSIRIVDERGGVVNQDEFTLKAGESITVPYTVVPVPTESVRSVSLVLTGKDPEGNDYTLQPSRKYEVYPFVDGSAVNTAVYAEILEPWTAESGSVKVRLTISNDSTVELRNIAISEISLGVLENMDTLPSGAVTVEKTLKIGSPRNLTFSVKGEDVTGVTRQLGSCLLEIAYLQATQAPVSTPLPAQDNQEQFVFSAITSTISRVLLILGILMLAAFAALLILSGVERQKAARMRRSEMRLFGEQTEVRNPEFEVLDQGATPISSHENEDRQEPPLFSGRAYAPARRARPAFERPVEIEYDDEQSGSASQHDTERPLRTPPSYGPKVVHTRPEPAAQTQVTKTVKRITPEKREDHE